MTQGQLEHANITVSDPHRSAALLSDLFGWHIRWEGPSMSDGHTIHIGTDTNYVALYTNPEVRAAGAGFNKGQPMNHIGVTVDDLDAVEPKVVAAGLKPFNHDDYDPGRRFYFFDWDGIEWEVVSYG
ncbi:MAG: VOC family protein [Sphingorhabdus sp.]